MQTFDADPGRILTEALNALPSDVPEVVAHLGAHEDLPGSQACSVFSYELN